MTTFANIEIKNLETQQALLKVRDALANYNDDTHIQNIISNIDNIELQWVEGNTQDVSKINEMIRNPLSQAFLNAEKSRDKIKTDDIFNCLMIISSYWPIITYDEDEHSYLCPLALVPLNEADRIIFTTGSQIHESMLTDYLIESIGKGDSHKGNRFKDPLNKISLSNHALATLLAQRPATIQEYRMSPKRIEKRKEIYSQDYYSRMKNIVKIIMGLTAMYIIATMIFIIPPVATLVITLAYAASVPLLLGISSLMGAAKSYLAIAKVDRTFDKLEKENAYLLTFKNSIADIKDKTIALSPDSPSAYVAIDVRPESPQGTTSAIMQHLNLQAVANDAKLTITEAVQPDIRETESLTVDSAHQSPCPPTSPHRSYSPVAKA